MSTGTYQQSPEHAIENAATSGENVNHKAVQEALASLGDEGTLKRVKVEELNVDHHYQRDIGADLVNTIADNWNAVAGGVILVSRRENGQLYIVNGQHRAAAARLLGKKHLWAQIVDGLGPAEEAELRLLTNVARKDKSLERFKAKLAAGHTDAHAIVRIVSAHGARINATPQGEIGINAISAVEAIYHIDRGMLLDRTLETLTTAYGRIGGDNATSAMLRGVAWLLHRHADLDHGRLIQRMQVEGPGMIGRMARNHKAAMGGALWLNVYRALVETYNFRLPEGSPNRLSWITSGSTSVGLGQGEAGTTTSGGGTAGLKVSD